MDKFKEVQTKPRSPKTNIFNSPPNNFLKFAFKEVVGLAISVCRGEAFSMFGLIVSFDSKV